MRAVRSSGGHILVQDEATSVVFGMPRAAVEAGLADAVLPLAAIAPHLVCTACRLGRAEMVRILVAEDSPTQAARLVTALEEHGFSVVGAVDGEQALKLFAASRFDIVISDVVMPGMSGYELCRAIKADRVHANVPVICSPAERADGRDPRP